MFTPTYYFDFREGDFLLPLFQESIFVWDVIKKLYLYLENQNLGKIEICIPEGVYLENPDSISIGEGTIIEPGVYIKGPAWIGRRCEIRQGAYLRGPIILGDGSLVGHSTELKNSILFPKAQAAHFNYVGDSILGSHTNLGAGVKCANVRLDRREIGISVKGEKIGTGMRKLGLILGDRSQIGCNTVTNPGTLVGKEVLCPSCISLKGVIPSGARVRALQSYSIEE